MKHALLRRSLVGWVHLLRCLAPLALRPTATWSPATSSETSDGGAAESPQQATGTWFGWENLGKVNGNPVQDPVIGKNQDGRLELFAMAEYGATSMDRTVYRRNQTAVNGAGWTAWANLGALEPGIGVPAVATNPAGRLEVFAAGEVSLAGSCFYRSAIKQISQSSANNGWYGWWNMGQPSTACYVAKPYVAMNSDGRLDMFTAASDSNIYHRWQTAPSGNWNATWTSIGAPAGASPWYGLAVGNNADGRIALFTVANNAGGYDIYHAWQNTVNDETSWSAWTGFGRPSSSVDLDDPVLARNQDGRLDVFSTGSDGNLWHKWQVAPNSNWSAGWENLGQPSGGA